VFVRSRSIFFFNILFISRHRNGILNFNPCLRLSYRLQSRRRRRRRGGRRRVMYKYPRHDRIFVIRG
jgi:hypothetical protein